MLNEAVVVQGILTLRAKGSSSHGMTVLALLLLVVAVLVVVGVVGVLLLPVVVLVVVGLALLFPGGRGFLMVAMDEDML